jgi:hypothetical protein
MEGLFTVFRFLYEFAYEMGKFFAPMAYAFWVSFIWFYIYFYMEVNTYRLIFIPIAFTAIYYTFLRVSGKE